LETLLTLIIPLGGVATGIGAIWTAFLARRQNLDQRRFLEEQNDRARLILEFDILARMEARYESSGILQRRRSAAGHIVDVFFAEDGPVQAGAFDRASYDVANFFEEVGYLHRSGCSGKNQRGTPSAWPPWCTGTPTSRPSARCAKSKKTPPSTRISSGVLAPLSSMDGRRVQRGQ
jgi:hypothetical protein